MNHVDTAQKPFRPITCVEFFAGYMGLSLGVGLVEPRLRVIAACEIEAYALANLVAKMEGGRLDPAPLWSDADTFPARDFHGLVDVFMGGYPCQGESTAGKRKGRRDHRWKWPACYRFIEQARPRSVFFENVQGHVTSGLRTVLRDLESLGYRRTWGLFTAGEVGARHKRKRCFIYGELDPAVEVADGQCHGRNESAKVLRRGESEPALCSETLAHDPRDGSQGRMRLHPRPGREGNGALEPHGKRQALAITGREPVPVEERPRNPSATPDAHRSREALAPVRPDARGEHPRDAHGLHPSLADSERAVADQPFARQQGRRLEHAGELLPRPHGGGFPHAPGPGEWIAAQDGGFIPLCPDALTWCEVLATDPSLEPAFCFLAHERPFRVDELRLAGNGVNPLQAALAWQTLRQQFHRDEWL